MSAIIKKIQRKLSGFYNTKPHKILPNKVVISFTFDDVPETAISVGAKILEDNNVAGTFYLSGSLENNINLDLPQYVTSDIQRLLDAGHEIGCHTFGHINIQDKSAAKIEDDLDKNFTHLKKHIGDHDLTSFSYPFGCVSVTAKKIIRRRFSSARGIKSGVNKGIVDLSQLKANALYSNMSKEKIVAFIDEAVRDNGWLIFYTHDISDAPTAYGCNADLFEFAVKQAIKSDCEILCMRAALARKSFKKPAA